MCVSWSLLNTLDIRKQNHKLPAGQNDIPFFIIAITPRLIGRADDLKPNGMK